MRTFPFIIQSQSRLDIYILAVRRVLVERRFILFLSKMFRRIKSPSRDSEDYITICSADRGRDHAVCSEKTDLPARL